MWNRVLHYGAKCKILATVLLRVWNWMSDYCGFGASVIRAFQVVLMTFFVLSPWFTWPFLLGHPSPYAEIIYILFWLWFLSGAVGAAYVGYCMERRHERIKIREES